jgi:hypothetical protein
MQPKSRSQDMLQHDAGDRLSEAEPMLRSDGFFDYNRKKTSLRSVYLPGVCKRFSQILTMP